ncbi:MAG TPA: hypothetical protein ENG87_00615 [Candidatus Pacearchaeota archaeon]|nr:hypothetical protein BMS3Abin17_00752 [archaeon BMS3Abin17]HDK41851.1 hypothetical protein [Candidatus Pacearchaeota archaeon]HDZ60875.1 hypothetical protein [Candidatus Pacearchaeota archaeon]
MGKIIIDHFDLFERNVVPVYSGPSEGKQVKIKGLITKVARPWPIDEPKEMIVLRRFHTQDSRILEQKCILKKEYSKGKLSPNYAVYLGEVIRNIMPDSEDYSRSDSLLTQAKCNIEIIQ